MENASKALIMAGAVLLAIMIISLGIMVFKRMAGSLDGETTLDKQEIANFNSLITPYMGESVSGSKVNELIQVVRTINQRAKKENDTKKLITVVVGENPGRTDVEALERFKSGGYFYTVKGDYNTSTGYITTITITENTQN